MHKNYGFKFNLLLGTFLVAGTLTATQAYSRNYRVESKLPSIEINFSVIEKLRKKELAKLKIEQKTKVVAGADNNSPVYKEREVYSSHQADVNEPFATETLNDKSVSFNNISSAKESESLPWLDNPVRPTRNLAIEVVKKPLKVVLPMLKPNGEFVEKLAPSKNLITKSKDVKVVDIKKTTEPKLESFIKVTEKKKGSPKSEPKESKVSLFKFSDNVHKKNASIETPVDVSELPKKLPEDNGVKPNADIVKSDIASDANVAKSAEPPESYKDKLLGAFSGLSNIKNIFVSKDDDNKVSAIVEKKEDVDKPVKENSVLESKALIPVNVEDLEDISKALDENLDGGKRDKPDYLASLGGDVQVILPNKVDDNKSFILAPSPKYKPITKIQTSENGGQLKNKDNINKKKVEALKNPSFKAVKTEKNLQVKATPISEEKWNEELKKAKQKALIKNPVSDVESNNDSKKVEDSDSGKGAIKTSGVLYLEDIAQSLKKQKELKKKHIDNTIANDVGNITSKDYENLEKKADKTPDFGNKNINSSKVAELAGLQMAAPAESFDVASEPVDSPGLLKINFKADEVGLTQSDKDKIKKLISDIKNSKNKLEIVSYAASSDPDDARRISLKRAIAVRAIMLNSGINSDMVNVKAIGIAKSKKDENSINISLAH